MLSSFLYGYCEYDIYCFGGDGERWGSGGVFRQAVVRPLPWQRIVHLQCQLKGTCSLDGIVPLLADPG